MEDAKKGFKARKVPGPDPCPATTATLFGHLLGQREELGLAYGSLPPIFPGWDHTIEASIAPAADRSASCLPRPAEAGPEALSAPSQGRCPLAEYPQCIRRRHRAHVESSTETGRQSTRQTLQ